MVRISPKTVMLGVTLYAGSAVGGYLLLRPSPGAGGGAAEAPLVDSREHDSKRTFDKLARSYDADIRWDEVAMGIPLLRRYLLWRARGSVLEVSAGTGRNLTYYRGLGSSATTEADASESDGVTSVVAVDQSTEMLRVTAEKWAGSGGKDGAVKVLAANAQHLPLRSQVFDTVVDTFGLCSCADPEKVLREMQRVCRPGGRVLLLEHGKASYDWLNDIIDGSAPEHARKWGCWYNRDIEALVEKSGLTIEKSWRVHFGTTYVIVARPGEGAHRGDEGAADRHVCDVDELSSTPAPDDAGEAERTGTAGEIGAEKSLPGLRLTRLRARE